MGLYPTDKSTINPRLNEEFSITGQIIMLNDLNSNSLLSNILC